MDGGIPNQLRKAIQTKEKFPAKQDKVYPIKTT
jgi:hypothetical protein